MTVRLNSTEITIASDAWTPADDVWLQLDTETDTASVDVQVRLMADGPWSTIDTLHRTARPVTRIAYGAALRLVLRGNASRTAVKVRDQT